ncbi:MAG: putative translation initiation inhibitor, yjgF family [Rhodobacteraceae bacterium HLUCCA12]|nr:MAG: putative translation initiation inhibitor, yjgF family [Rhodobacteraceae bacterium HLUCCA12]
MQGTRWAISSGSKFEELAGYSRAVVDGEWVFTSATSGADPETGAFAPDAEAQARHALDVIAATLAKAGAGWSDVVQVRCYLADRADVVPVSKLLGALFAEPRPTNTTILCAFPIEDIRVEFEMVARKRG